jgi:hypothetical protein
VVSTSPDFLKILGPNNGSQLFGDMKLSYQLAVSISPILLLIPKKLSNKKIKRDYLIYVGVVLLHRQATQLTNFRSHMYLATFDRALSSKSRQQFGELSSALQVDRRLPSRNFDCSSSNIGRCWSRGRRIYQTPRPLTFSIWVGHFPTVLPTC